MAQAAPNSATSTPWCVRKLDKTRSSGGLYIVRKRRGLSAPGNVKGRHPKHPREEAPRQSGAGVYRAEAADVLRCRVAAAGAAATAVGYAALPGPGRQMACERVETGSYWPGIQRRP